MKYLLLASAFWSLAGAARAAVYETGVLCTYSKFAVIAGYKYTGFRTFKVGPQGQPLNPPITVCQWTLTCNFSGQATPMAYDRSGRECLSVLGTGCQDSVDTASVNRGTTLRVPGIAGQENADCRAQGGPDNPQQQKNLCLNLKVTYDHGEDLCEVAEEDAKR